MFELSVLKSMAAQSADLTSDARELSERDRDYYDGYQWTAAEIARATAGETVPTRPAAV